MIRILIADDHPVVREGLAAMLATQEDFRVEASVADGALALSEAVRLRPDVVLLDLEMPGMDGIDVLERIRGLLPGTPVVVFTAFDADERIVAAVRAGARGYLLKGAPRREIFEAVRAVHGGGSLLQPVVAEKLMRRMSEEAAEEALTPREIEVLELLAKGLPNKDLARVLGVAERTVKFHVSSILAKLGAGNRTEAVSIAVARGLVRV